MRVLLNLDDFTAVIQVSNVEQLFPLGDSPDMYGALTSEAKTRGWGAYRYAAGLSLYVPEDGPALSPAKGWQVNSQPLTVVDSPPEGLLIITTDLEDTDDTFIASFIVTGDRLTALRGTLDEATIGTAVDVWSRRTSWGIEVRGSEATLAQLFEAIAPGLDCELPDVPELVERDEIGMYLWALSDR